MAKPDRDVYIVKVGDQYRVRPAVAPVKGQTQGNSPAKDMSFRNATDETVWVVFPNGTGAADDSFQIPAGDEVKFSLKDLPPGPKPKPKVVQYMVVVSTPNGPVRATGESEPVIIINP